MYPHDRFLFDYSMGLSNSGSDELIGWVSDLLHGNDVKTYRSGLLGFDLANLPQSGGSGIAAERADPDRNRSWRIVARLFNRSDYPRGYQRRGL